MRKKINLHKFSHMCYKTQKDTNLELNWQTCDIIYGESPNSVSGDPIPCIISVSEDPIPRIISCLDGYFDFHLNMKDILVRPITSMCKTIFILCLNIIE